MSEVNDSDSENTRKIQEIYTFQNSLYEFWRKAKNCCPKNGGLTDIAEHKKLSRYKENLESLEANMERNPLFYRNALLGLQSAIIRAYHFYDERLVTGEI